MYTVHAYIILYVAHELYNL